MYFILLQNNNPMGGGASHHFITLASSYEKAQEKIKELEGKVDFLDRGWCTYVIAKLVG